MKPHPGYGPVPTVTRNEITAFVVSVLKPTLDRVTRGMVVQDSDVGGGLRPNWTGRSGENAAFKDTGLSFLVP